MISRLKLRECGGEFTISGRSARFGLGSAMAMTSGCIAISRHAPPLPARSLQLVSLYPISPPDNEYGLSSLDADFPSTFTQFSISIWCCQSVDIRVSEFNEPLMQFRPNQATVTLKDINRNIVFNGTFTNPGIAHIEYHIAFSIDTTAGTCTFYGNDVAWTPSGITFFPGHAIAFHQHPTTLTFEHVPPGNQFLIATLVRLCIRFHP